MMPAGVLRLVPYIVANLILIRVGKEMMPEGVLRQPRKLNTQATNEKS